MIYIFYGTLCRWRVGDTVATGLLKINPYFIFLQHKIPQKNQMKKPSSKFKPPNAFKINA